MTPLTFDSAMRIEMFASRSAVASLPLMSTCIWLELALELFCPWPTSTLAGPV